MLDVLYRSSDLLAIDKPSGISLLSDRSGAPCLWDTLRDELAAQGCEPFSIHRIDKGTSGVLLVALTRERQAQLTKSFADRDVRKFYVARVLGDVNLGGSTGTIDLPLTKGRKSRYRIAAPRERITRHGSRWHLSGRHHEGHDSVSRLRRIGGDGRHTLLALQPLTGRTHQLTRAPRVDRPSDSRRPSLWQTRRGRTAVAASGACIATAIVVDGIAIEAPMPAEFRLASTRHPTARRGESGRGRRRAARQRE